MEIRIYKPLWGHQGNLDEAIDQAMSAEFDGIEGPVPSDWEEARKLKDRLQESGLDLIAEVTTGGGYVPDPKASPHQHLDDLRRGIERSLPLSPRFLNTQAGLDAWDHETQVGFLRGVPRLEKEFGVSIAIETHRSRSTFSPWQTAALLREVPDLKITCDFSHWCCVAERLVMDDDPALLEKMAGQCHHVHARVGYDQGPQVPDPRAPEYGEAVERHRAWWEVLWKARQDRGEVVTTFTPEFGTDGYLHLAPFTQEPVADLWEVNCWMAERLREWFESDGGSGEE